MAQVQPLLDAMAGERVICPKTTVGQTMALIEGASLVVCNDSAPMHMAAGFNRPLVAIFGPTDPRLTGPYGLETAVVRDAELYGKDPIGYRHLRDDDAMVQRVSVEAVWQRMQAAAAGRV